MKRAALLLLPAVAGLAVAAPAAGARTVLPCNVDRNAETFVYLRAKPAACTILPATASFSQGIWLVHIRWRSWGGSAARASARSKSFHPGQFRPGQRDWVPVFIVAYRRQRCEDGTRWYSRVREYWRYHGRTYRRTFRTDTARC